MDAFIELGQTLGKVSQGPLTVPKKVMARLKDRTDRLHAEVGKVRNLGVHGGLVHSIAGERHLEVAALSGHWPSPSEIFASRADRQDAWAVMAHEKADVLLGEMASVIADLNAAVDWAKLRRAASGPRSRSSR